MDQPLWRPSQASIAESNLTKFRARVARDWFVELPDTDALWRWSVAEIERFFTDAELALAAIEFFKVRDREHVMRTVREVVHRVPLDQREAKLLRAMAIEVVKYRDRLARTGIHVDRE